MGWGSGLEVGLGGTSGGGGGGVGAAYLLNKVNHLSFLL